ncbi:MAG: histidinol-phosphate transaminase [Candidatus Altiarchaeota archaeon]|nr:histidinol-phosphate transaminase [Candidatus Altiarchaeota archaeon]
MIELKTTDYVKPWISGLEPYVPGQTRVGFIKLASNENNYGPSPKVVKEVRKWAGKIYMYPYRDSEVNEAVAKYARVSAENIVPGNGSDEIIDIIIKTFRGPVGALIPSFIEYSAFARIMGVEFIGSSLKDDFGFDADKFIRETGDANLLFLCSPNNPTGGVIPREDVVKVLGTGKIVVVDEAYYEFYGKSVAELVGEYDNLIVTRTMAKAFGLAGLRFGYAIASPKIAGAMLKVKPPFNVSLITQAAVIAALKDTTYMRKCVKRIKEDTKLLFNALNRKFTAYPTESNFVFIDTAPKYTSKEFFNRMLEKRFIVRPFGRIPGFPGEYSRVNAGTTEETKKFIKALNGI